MENWEGGWESNSLGHSRNVFEFWQAPHLLSKVPAFRAMCKSTIPATGTVAQSWWSIAELCLKWHPALPSTRPLPSSRRLCWLLQADVALGPSVLLGFHQLEGMCQWDSDAFRKQWFCCCCMAFRTLLLHRTHSWMDFRFWNFTMWDY